ncbi:hypothetical protein GCK72_003234 [Caenorhabditis remanei]|uniref:Uncharacterized protein n=1 Tax=Caenorhabditis remanei TaxID=31234 RepID=A0A6A5HTY5_CAERE|nr:hypothetical protein GCK72_003234 [Caenorhabditis remanei]KAF1771408.1 hypothetical protein GCK72_003234 [Caenorhabditis remanei]
MILEISVFESAYTPTFRLIQNVSREFSEYSSWTNLSTRSTRLALRQPSGILYKLGYRKIQRNNGEFAVYSSWTKNVRLVHEEYTENSLLTVWIYLKVKLNQILCALLLILCIQYLNGAEMTMKITMSGRNDDCAKYTAHGSDYLQITHARIFQSGEETNRTVRDGEIQIVGNILCEEKDKKQRRKPNEYVFTCHGTPAAKFTGIRIMFSVTTPKQMLSGPIDYRYQDGLMHLVENGYLDLESLKGQAFVHDRHIQIKGVNITGLYDKPTYLTTGNCHDEFPSKLIADHGLYMMHRKDNNTNTGSFTRMYFEPDGVGEYIPAE